jgi:hypothetical protein
VARGEARAGELTRGLRSARELIYDSRMPTAKKVTAKKKAPARKAPAKKAAPKASARALGRTVDDYVAGLTGFHADAAKRARSILRAAAPKAVESIKWGQPVYESNGPFAYFRAHAKAVNLGFWRGADLPDPKGLLVGDGDRMKHLKLTSATFDEAAVGALVRAAVKLNAERGDPTKRSAP